MDRKKSRGSVPDVSLPAGDTELAPPQVVAGFWKGEPLPRSLVVRATFQYCRRCIPRRPASSRRRSTAPPPPPARCLVLCAACSVLDSPLPSTPPLAEFDLEGLRSRLDEQGLAVATAQEASVKSRKALADRTKGACARGLEHGTCMLLLWMFAEGSNVAADLVKHFVLASKTALG